MTPIDPADKNPKIVNATTHTHTTDSGSMLAWLLGGLALVAALGGLWYQSSQVNAVRQELAQTHDRMEKMRADVDTSVATVKEQSKVTLDESSAKFQAELAKARKEAQIQAARATNAVRQQTGKAVKELAEKNEQLVTEVTDLRKANETRSTQVDETLNTIKGDVGGVRTDIAATRTELEKTSNELRRMTGDMGVMSGLIATNASELQALRNLGERDYFEFTLNKASAKTQKVGGIQLELKKADQKRSRFTLDVVADDHKVEKKDKGLNEPVQFYTSQARIPYEIVVNQISKDKVVGYLSVPKVKMAAR